MTNWITEAREAHQGIQRAVQNTDAQARGWVTYQCEVCKRDLACMARWCARCASGVALPDGAKQ